MAEVEVNEEGDGQGAANGEDNPFSFKTFVKRTSSDIGAKGGKRDGGKRTRSTAAKAKVPFPEEGSVQY